MAAIVTYTLLEVTTSACYKNACRSRCSELTVEPLAPREITTLRDPYDAIAQRSLLKTGIPL
jgi:hypothetical protein